METNIRIASWNVNSINSRINNLKSYLEDKNNSPDILCLQELKCLEEKFPFHELDSYGYNIILSGQKTYNGVAILSKLPFDEFNIKFPSNEIDHNQARFIEAVISLNDKAIRIINLYVPNGSSVTSDKFEYKKIFYKSLYNYLKNLRKLDEQIIICGDFNVAPEDIDVYAPDKLRENICFTKKEQSWFNSLIGLGYTDIYRAINPTSHEFTWWDYRAGCFEHNKGMRIDHILASPNIAANIKKCEILSNIRAQDKPSDHAPIFCEL